MQNIYRIREKCELCGGQRQKILLSKYFSDSCIWHFMENYYQGRLKKEYLGDGKYEIIKCLDCGFIWQKNILNEQLMYELYNHWIDLDDSIKKRKNAKIVVYSGYAREVEKIAYLLKKKPCDLNILDFGMGWGYWCLMAKAFSYNIVGFEVGERKIKTAEKNGIKVLSNLAEIGDYQFDFINANAVFEHIVDPLRLLKTVVASLRSGGIAMISVPVGNKIEKSLLNPQWQASKDAILPLEHINCFTHETLIQFGEKAGLRIIAQPFLLGYRQNWKSCLKGFLNKYYQQYWGTLLYFQKQ